MAGQFHHGGLETLLYDVVKVKSELPWRSQDGDARALGYLARRAGDRRPRERSVLQSTEMIRIGYLRTRISEEHVDIRCGDAEFGVCPPGFLTCFGSGLPQYAVFPLVCDGHKHSASLYVGNMGSVFFVNFDFVVSNSYITLSLRRDFGF